LTKFSKAIPFANQEAATHLTKGLHFPFKVQIANYPKVYDNKRLL